MKKDKQVPRVVHYNKRGEIIDPAHYFISRAEHPELYKFLAEASEKKKDAV